MQGPRIVDNGCDALVESCLTFVTWLKGSLNSHSHAHLKRYLAEHTQHDTRRKALHDACARTGSGWHTITAEDIMKERLSAFRTACHHAKPQVCPFGVMTDGLRIGKHACELMVTAIQEM